ncbi:NADH-quinone oxidoreductase subunit M [Tessaracoccus sp. OH4464_COT-324]|uniref:NADH-quinone oxidoreductase subunit M n=1 Tax=Tessaracoccus sp. OH4464_COT-324 TaxID=2491059 RepID=UPI000F635145|nr:NADH-quinone oxidoreductase subunit M [Tessaracoccus sp. OH4464_COT-324]RRD46977.1 NADH-quinone oxidoreductase subunit M [Tessaracoccus sp. OH4464_COT-324]
MLLTILALLPIVGAAVVALLKGNVAKLVGLGFALTTLVFGGTVAVLSFSGVTSLAISVPWIRPIGAYYALDMMPMDAVLVLLTVILLPVVLLAEWRIDDRPDIRGTAAGFFSLALLMQGLALFVFLAGDLLLFYLAFEATLIPVYFMIGRFGGTGRRRAAIKFLLYSLAGGLVLLVGVVGLYASSVSAGKPSMLIGDLAALSLDPTTANLLFVAVFFAFAVKAPLVGLHSWLPDTAAAATSGTSTLLVGILDKIGTFGLIKICLVIFPGSMQWAAPVVLVWAVVSMFYGALMAFQSKDMLRLVSYTSISHFGFMVLGIFALTTQSMTGSIFYMLNHGFSTAALFLMVGFLVARRGSADINAFGGVQKVAPVLAGFFLLSGLSALALPGMASFVSEFLVMAGSFQRYPAHVAVIALGMVLAAVYVLRLYKTTMTGPVTEQVEEHIKHDLSLRERAAVFPLIVLLLILGFVPKPALSIIDSASQGFLSVAGVTDPTPQLKEGGR